MKDDGFSLLEVVVALAIMAGGFLAVLQLYSMSVRSIGISEKYLKGTMLAQSKMAELELNDFDLDKDVGKFEYEEGYRWKVEIFPYDSPFNSEEENIQLSSIKLTVFWNEDEKVRSVNFYTLNLDGSRIPMLDQRLEKIFSGGRAVSSRNDSDLDNDRDIIEDAHSSKGRDVGNNGCAEISGNAVCSSTGRKPGRFGY